LSEHGLIYIKSRNNAKRPSCVENAEQPGDRPPRKALRPLLRFRDSLFFSFPEKQAVPYPPARSKQEVNPKDTKGH
jgi:hypothetical protein